MEAIKLLDDEHQVIDEFVVARLLNIKVGGVRGLRRRGMGPELVPSRRAIASVHAGLSQTLHRRH